MQLPRVLNLQASDHCDSRCVMCRVWKSGEKHPMSVEAWGTRLRQPFFREVRQVGLTGGEPTLRGDLVELFGVLHSSLPRLEGASFITNGRRGERCARLLEAAHRLCVSKGVAFNGMVSLDGVGQVHDRVRGRKGSFDGAVETLHALRQAGVPAMGACTIVKSNLYDLHDLLEWGAAQGFYIRFRVAEFIRRLHNAGCTEEVRNFNPREVRHLVSFFQLLLSHHEPDEAIRRTYRSIVSLLTGGTRLTACPYQQGAAVNLDSRGRLAACAPKGEPLPLDADAVGLHERLTEQRTHLAAEHCARCIHDYHGEWSSTAESQRSRDQASAAEIYRESLAPDLELERPASSPALNTARRILLVGWYGTETAGDVAILHGIVSDYLDREPELSFCLLSLHPEYTRTTLDLWPAGLRERVCVSGYDSQVAQDWTQDCDRVVMAGGPLMDLEETRRILCLFQRFAEQGKACVLEGCGVGPLHHPVFRWNVCRIARLATSISVRDRASRQALRDLGIRKPIEVRSDPAVTSVRQLGVRHFPNGSRVIRCFLRELTPEYPQAVRPEEATEILRGFLHRLLTWHPDHRVELHAMHHFPVGNDDRLFARRLARDLGNERLSFAWEPQTPEQLVRAMADAAFCVCMRFHSCVFALEVGVPFLAIDYTAGGKIAGLLSDNGVSWRRSELSDLSAMTREDLEQHLQGDKRCAPPHVSVLGSTTACVPRVLHLIQCLETGGGSRALLSLAKHSQQRGGFDHQILSLKEATSPGRELARRSGVPLIDRADEQGVWQAVAQADIVLVHWWNCPELAHLLRRDWPLARLALWLHVGGYHPPQVLTPALFRFADIAVACSPHTRHHPAFEVFSEQEQSERAAMVLAGADFDRLRGLTPRPHRGIRVGYIGTVDPVKMHRDFIALCAAVNYPDVRFVVCGSGDTAWLRADAERLGVSDRFEFRGHVEDIRGILEELDIYGYPLCPETYAAAELNLQEAMYAGLPVVAFPHGGIPLLIQPESTGELVETPEAYASAVEALAQDPERRQRLGSAAAAHARLAFGAENAAREFDQLFERLLRRPKRSRQWDDGAHWLMRASIPTCEEPPRALAVHRGARAFLESLGQDAAPFLQSLDPSSPALCRQGQKVIRRASPLMRSPGAGGIAHYRAAFPADPVLAFWQGLLHLEDQNHEQAIASLTDAFQSGLRIGPVVEGILSAATAQGVSAASLLSPEMGRCLRDWLPSLERSLAGEVEDLESVRLLVASARACASLVPDSETAEVQRPQAPAARPKRSASAVALARRLADQGDLAGARDWIERALDYEPDQPDVVVLLDRVLRELGELESLRGSLSQLSRQIGHRTYPLVLLAQLHLDCGDVEQFEQALAEALQRDPGAPDAWVLLAQLHQRLGHTDEAANAYARVLEREPDHTEAQRGLTTCRAAARANGAPRESGQHAPGDPSTNPSRMPQRRNGHHFPSRVEAELRAAESALEAGNASEARPYLQSVVAACPDLAPARVALAQVCVQLGDEAGAHEQFEVAARLQPEDVPTLLGLARSCLRVNELPGLESALSQALTLAPDSAEALQLSADCNFRLGRFEQAGRSCLHILERSPGDVAALRRLGQVLLESGYYAAAAETCQRILNVQASAGGGPSLSGGSHRAGGSAWKPTDGASRSDLKTLQANWEAFGASDPMWAILTDPAKQGNRWGTDEFYATGERNIEILLDEIRSLGLLIPHRKALDFGCGLGRLSQALGRRFDAVWGIDIAASMIAGARRHNQLGDRCTYLQNERDDLQMFSDGMFDLVYSLITLQHIPPVHAKNYLREFVRILSPGGLLVFQLPSHTTVAAVGPPPGRVSAFDPKHPVMEMNAVPRDEVLELLRASGAEAVHLAKDTSLGQHWVSYRYFVRRRIHAPR